MPWVAFFAVVALGFYVSRATVKRAKGIVAEAEAREAEAKRAEAEALRDAEQIRASAPVRRGRPRKTTP